MTLIAGTWLYKVPYGLLTLATMTKLNAGLWTLGLMVPFMYFNTARITVQSNAEAQVQKMTINKDGTMVTITDMTGRSMCYNIDSLRKAGDKDII